jgi:hypothetical protein
MKNCLRRKRETKQKINKSMGRKVKVVCGHAEKERKKFQCLTYIVAHLNSLWVAGMPEKHAL